MEPWGNLQMVLWSVLVGMLWGFVPGEWRPCLQARVETAKGQELRNMMVDNICNAASFFHFSWVQDENQSSKLPLETVTGAGAGF